MRQPTFFRVAGILRDEKKFGKNREIAWQFSFSDRFFRKILVKFFSRYEVRENCDRKVIFSGSLFNQIMVEIRSQKKVKGSFPSVKSESFIYYFVCTK